MTKFNPKYLQKTREYELKQEADTERAVGLKNIVMPNEVVAGGKKRWCETCKNNNGIFNYNCKVCVTSKIPEMYDETDDSQREA